MDDVKSNDLGTWGYLGAGWWVLHIVGIALFIYIGYYLGHYYQ
jgi:hypothetical protein